MLEINNPFEAMQARLRVASELYGLDETLFKVFMAPVRSMIVSLPVHMDDGRWEVFTGYRVQHNIARASAELGDKADALRRLEAIIKAVPGTNDAKAAEKSIESLGLRKAKKKR